MAFTIRNAGAADAPLLAQLARDSFVETFGHLYPPGDLNAFLESSYAEPVVAADLADPQQQWLLAHDRAGRAAGYAQMGPCTLPHPRARDSHGELKRLYVRAFAQGGGLGQALLERALAWIGIRFNGPIWIGVWSENARALSLYSGFGFEKTGEYEFEVGRTRDLEFILVRD